MGNSTVTPEKSAAEKTNTATATHRESISGDNHVNSTNSKRLQTPPTLPDSSHAIAAVDSASIDTSANRATPIQPFNETIPVIPLKRNITIDNPKSTAPITSLTPTVTVVSPTITIPIVSPEPSINDTNNKWPDAKLRTNRDSSALYPAFNTPTSVAPLHTHSPLSKTKPHVANDLSHNQNIQPQSTTLFPVSATSKQTDPSTFILTSKPIRKDSKSNREQPPIAPSKKWHYWETDKTDEEEDIHGTPKIGLSKPMWMINSGHQPKTPPISHIVPVPSYTLRSTAVCTSVPDHGYDDESFSEQSIPMRDDISILKFYLDHKETERVAGNHTKATMFKMNTQLKQTPFPQPSLTLFNKNFSDGTFETDTEAVAAPTFQALGLKYDFDTEGTNLSLKNAQSTEKQQPKITHDFSFADANLNGNSSVEFNPLTTLNLWIPFPLGAVATKDHQQVASILKKPAPNTMSNPTSPRRYSKTPQNFQKSKRDKRQRALSIRSTPKSSQSKFSSGNLFSSPPLHGKK